MTTSRPASPKGARNQALAELLQKGLALHQSGRPDEAAVYYERVLAQDKRQPAANHLLGLVRLKQGRPEEAVELISRAVAAKPDEAQLLCNLGVALNAAGRNDEAVVALQKAVAINPVFAEALSNLGMAYRALGRFDESISSYRHAIRLKPGEPGFHYNLANALADAGYLFETESAYRRAVHLRPNYPAAIGGLASLMDKQGRAGESIELIDKALDVAPNDASLHLRRSRALYFLGRLDDSVTSFDKTIALNPGLGEAHLHRSLIVRHESGDVATEQMHRLFHAEDTPIEDRIFAGFGLGKALADIGDHDASIATYIDANRQHRQRTPFSLERATSDLSGDLARFNDIDGPSLEGGMGEAAPIFVVGLPRAGKSTIEAILSRHPSVTGAGELPTLSRLVSELMKDLRRGTLGSVAPQRFAELGRTYLREAQSFVPHGQMVVDTMPSNYRHIGFIRMALPNARIVHCVRAPAEHAIAIFEKYLTGGGYEYANDLGELRPFMAAVAAAMRGWHERFPGRIHDVDIGRLSLDRRGETRKLLEFCGLAWDEACLAEAQSEPHSLDWPHERVIANRARHLAAWRQARPQLFA